MRTLKLEEVEWFAQGYIYLEYVSVLIAGLSDSKAHEFSTVPTIFSALLKYN